MKLKDMELRDCDNFGKGHFHASRAGGRRLHKGVDPICEPSTEIESPVAGEVTKIGYPYGDDLSYRYVQVTAGGYDFRMFYVDPCVERGDIVTCNTVIGSSQDLDPRYPGITPHVHYEIKNLDGEWVDPTPTLLVGM